MTDKIGAAELSHWHPAWLAATWFGVGRLPKAPGTWGSLAALPFAWLTIEAIGAGWTVAVSALLFAIGWWAATRYVLEADSEDPGEVVIDEVAGMFLTVAVVPPGQPMWLLVGFVLFRIFDIWKPWPVSWAERRFKAGLAVMADDIVAGLYALPLLFILIQLTS